MIDKIYELISNNINIYEFLYIFLVTIFTIILILIIIWHNNYRIAINKNMCNNKNISSKDLKVLVKFKDEYNDTNNLYSIEYKNYKKKSKEPYIKCECPTGDTINKFTEIPIFYNGETYKKELICNCDSKYHNKEESLYYYGNNGLKRYMKNQEEKKIFEFDD